MRFSALVHKIKDWHLLVLLKRIRHIRLYLEDQRSDLTLEPLRTPSTGAAIARA